MTFATALVEVSFEWLAFLPVVFDFSEMFPLGTKRFWKAVGEVKG